MLVGYYHCLACSSAHNVPWDWLGVTLTLDLQIGVEGVAHLRVALACCPNLHRLDIKVSPWAPYCCFRLGSGGHSCAASSFPSALHQ